MQSLNNVCAEYILVGELVLHRHVAGSGGRVTQESIGTFPMRESELRIAFRLQTSNCSEQCGTRTRRFLHTLHSLDDTMYVCMRVCTVYHVRVDRFQPVHAHMEWCQ